MPKLLYKFMSVLQVTSVRRALGLTPLQGAFDPAYASPFLHTEPHWRAAQLF